MIRRVNPVTLTKDLSLNRVQVDTLQAPGRENGIAVTVSLDTQNHVSAIQIQQVVRERTDGAGLLTTASRGSRLP